VETMVEKQINCGKCNKLITINLTRGRPHKYCDDCKAIMKEESKNKWLLSIINKKQGGAL
jgi:phage FluMu protein Com